MAAGNRRQFSNARHALAETSSLVLVEAADFQGALASYSNRVDTSYAAVARTFGGKIRREQRLRRSSRTHPAVSGPRTPPHSSAPLRSLTGAPTWVRRGSTCRPGSKTSARSADRSLTCRWTLLLRLFLQMRRSRRCNLPRRDDDRHRDDAALLAHLHIGCVEPDMSPSPSSGRARRSAPCTNVAPHDLRVRQPTRPFRRERSLHFSTVVLTRNGAQNFHSFRSGHRPPRCTHRPMSKFQPRSAACQFQRQIYV